MGTSTSKPALRPSSDAQTSGRYPLGVSFVIPVHNGRRWLREVIASIQSQEYDGPIEIIAVEDGSTDGSHELLAQIAGEGQLTLVGGERRGAAAAINLGIRAASHPLIAQIDQDVVIEPAWLIRLTAMLSDPSIAAAQGHYIAAPDAGPWSRVMALDLRQRYSTLRNGLTNHACTGNSVFRRTALLEVGLFDETLGYGYDNDMSYRLVQAGYRLAFRADARSTHHWREGLLDYARQQYGFGYGRLDLVAKHHHRIGGDDVSRIAMMLHAPLMGGALVAGALAVVLTALGAPAKAAATAAAALFGVLAAERLVAGIRAAVTFGEAGGLLFVPIHLIRDIAWVAAIAVWGMRRVRGVRPQPSDSMRPREASASSHRRP